MDHTAALRQIAATYFEASLGLSVEQLLTPIASDSPAGKPMRGTREYSAIQHSRRADDASLPMGGWEHELKRADWHAVSRMAAQVLCVQSKDLACVAWLFEARLHIDGFAAIAPCLTLLDALLNQYWDNIHPLSDDGDLDSRANQIRWIAEKLLPVLRQTPMTASQDNTQYGWADWQQGQRNSHLKVRMRRHPGTRRKHRAAAVPPSHGGQQRRALPATAPCAVGGAARARHAVPDAGEILHAIGTEPGSDGRLARTDTRFL